MVYYFLLTWIYRDLKEQINDISFDHQNSPSLLGGILLRKPDVFKGKHGKLIRIILINKYNVKCKVYLTYSVHM